MFVFHCLLTALVMVASDNTLPVQDKLAPYRGLPLVAVAVDAPAGENPSALRDLVGIHPGYLTNQENIQQAIKRLFALGRFSAVEVFARREHGAVSLRFELRSVTSLGAMTIDDVPSEVDEAALRKALRLLPGDEIDSRTNAVVQQAAVAYLDRAGFPQARVDIERTPGEDVGSVNLRLRVHPGPPVRLARLTFAGSTRVMPYALRQLTSYKPGDILNAFVLDEDRQRIANAYHKRGFLRATAAPAEITRHGMWADVTLTINAGPRIQIAIRGNRAFATKQLMRLWPNATNSLAPGDLHSFAARLQMAYQNAGYPDATVRIRGFQEPQRGILRYVFVINEGHVVRVAALTFSGNRAFTDDLLRAQVFTKMAQELAQSPFADEPLAATELNGLWGDDQLIDPTPPSHPALMPPAKRWVPNVYQEALEDIEAIYRGFGHLSVKVGPLQTTRRGDDMLLHVPIVEGPQTFIDAVSFNGNKAFAAAALLALVENANAADQRDVARVSPGQPLSTAAIEDGRIALMRHYRDRGFLFASVFSDVSMDTSAADTGVGAGTGGVWGRVSYRIEEGPQVRIRSVIIRGTRHTEPSLIRDRLGFAPGDLYSLEKALQAQQTIASLGIFFRVRVRLIDEEIPAERKDLVVEVEERKRQEITLSPGFSTADGPRLRVAYSHLNIFKSATAFSSSLKLNRKVLFQFYGNREQQQRQRYDAMRSTLRGELLQAVERQARIGVRSPPLVTWPTSPTLRFDLLNERENAIAYSLDSGAAIVGLDAFLGHGLKFTFEPRVSLTELQCVGPDEDCSQDPQLNATRSRRIDEGLRWMVSAGPELSLDLRDSPLSPKSGLYVWMRSTYAFGGWRQLRHNPFAPFAFVRLQGKATAYIPVGRAVFALSLHGGGLQLIGGTGIPIDERFFLGGRASLRGFLESTLLPQDTCVILSGDRQPAHCVEPIVVSFDETTHKASPPLSNGGNLFVLYKMEARLPLGNALFFDLFVDVGNLWIVLPTVSQTFTLRLGTGAGIRYATPVGDLTLDLGINPMRRTYTHPEYGALYTEPLFALHFSVGAF